MSTPFDVAAMRSEMPVVRRWVYLDHAAVAPLPARCRAAVDRYLDELSENGDAHYPTPVARVLGDARRAGARLMGARPEEIFMVRSTSHGLGLAASGLPVKDGDNVVLVEGEFPANVRPWLALRSRGIEVRLVPQIEGRVDYEGLAGAIDARTAAVSVSFVQFHSGYRADLGRIAELCRPHDALLVVDAIQGLGVLPFDVSCGVDFVSADSHKWMLGPEGAGLGYVSSRALERLVPAIQGWLSVADPWALHDLEQPLKPTAARFEEGAANLAGLYGMVASLDWLLDLGTGSLERRLLELGDLVAEGLQARGWRLLTPWESTSERSGIVTATRADADLGGLREGLKDAGVVITARGGALRVSPHAYNDESDLERLFDALDSAL